MSTSKAILITLLISLGIVIFTGYRITSRNLTVANQLVGEVQKLNVGQSSDSDLKQLDRKYHRYVDVSSCAGEECRLGLRIGGSWYRAVGLARDRGIFVELETKKGVLVFKEIVVAQDDCCAVYVGFSEHLSSTTPTYNLIRNGADRPSKVLVHLTHTTPEVQQRDAYSFDLHCFRNLRGCQSAADLFPAWNRYLESVDGR
jgi:hypothetical protein